MALIKNNAKVAAQIAVELHSLDEEKESNNESYPVIFFFFWNLIYFFIKIIFGLGYYWWIHLRYLHNCYRR